MHWSLVGVAGHVLTDDSEVQPTPDAIPSATAHNQRTL